MAEEAMTDEDDDYFNFEVGSRKLENLFCKPITSACFQGGFCCVGFGRGYFWDIGTF